MKKISIENFPVGLCPKCLERLRAGWPVEPYPLWGGRAAVLTVFCVERQVGGWALVEGGVVGQWALRVPITVEDWNTYVATLPANLEFMDAKVAAARLERGSADAPAP